VSRLITANSAHPAIRRMSAASSCLAHLSIESTYLMENQAAVPQ